MTIKPLKVKREASLFQSAIIASVFAVMIAALWSLDYLSTTSFILNWHPIDVITGAVPNTVYSPNDLGLLIAIVFALLSRVILGFGLSWLPLTGIVWILQLIRAAL